MGWNLWHGNSHRVWSSLSKQVVWYAVLYSLRAKKYAWCNRPGKEADACQAGNAFNHAGLPRPKCGPFAVCLCVVLVPALSLTQLCLSGIIRREHF